MKFVLLQEPWCWDLCIWSALWRRIWSETFKTSFCPRV